MSRGSSFGRSPVGPLSIALLALVVLSVGVAL